MKDEIQAFVERMMDLGAFELDVSVAALGDGDYRVVLTGPDRGLVLGRAAELLDAFEYILNRVFGAKLKHDAKIVFDCGNYRAMREQELRMMAEKAAERVRGSRVPFVFDAMPPGERRIIHLALVDDASVRTESVGAGSDRKVKVLPA